MALERFLMNTAKNVHPSTEEITKGKKLVDSIFRDLQQKSKFSIDRCELVGSTAKKTSIAGHVDFDCVVFVNNNRENTINLKHVVSVFQDILLMNYSELEEDDIKLTPRRDPRTLQIELQHIKIDIVVEFNQVINHNNGLPAHKEQAKYLMKQYGSGKYSPLKMYRSSGGLSKMAVEFCKKQSSFAHEIARLGKYWNKTLFLDLKLRDQSYVSGRSSIMELIAIDAANEEEQSDNRSYLKAFRIFLVKVRNIKKIKIKFSQGLGSEISPPSNPYYIIDPANPYHNYLEGISHEILQAFSSFANETLERLNKAECIERLGGIPSYNEIFKVQPTWSNASVPLMVKPLKWLVGIHSCSSQYVDLKFNSRCNHSIKTAKEVQIMKCYLSDLVQRVRVMADAKNYTNRQIQDDVENAISGEIVGTSTPWIPTEETHDSRMTTVTIPFCNGTNQAVKVSCDWQK